MKIKAFQNLIWDYYSKNKRNYPWRDTVNPYHIWVSEIMLQQTQTDRTIPKYLEFLDAFPTISDLAVAEQAHVLRLWKGLGYNRRALYLKKAAEIVVNNYRGSLPNERKLLLSLPGIGPYTASAILTFAYNQPEIFIETNIRTVFIHHFFKDEENISDSMLMPLIEKSVDRNNPRDWYYALMDYGSWLKKTHPNPSRKSRHYTKQSKFEGSDRQLRGKVLELLLNDNTCSTQKVQKYIDSSVEKTEQIIIGLEKEGFLVREKNSLRLK